MPISECHRLVLNEVKPNVYRETYLQIFYPSTQSIFIPLWLRCSCSSVGLRYTLRQLTKTRLPPLIPASSLLLFPCGVALVWLMADSDERVSKRPCYRAGPGREGEIGRFSGKINKLINKSVGMGVSASAAHQSRVVKSGRSPC